MQRESDLNAKGYSERDEKRILDALGRGLLKEFPNPDRAGCPGSDVLRKIASHEMPLPEAEKWLELRWVAGEPRGIRLRFTHRGSRRVAEWDYVKSSGQITSRNRLAAELGWWPPPPEPKRAKGAEEEEINRRKRRDV